MKKVPRFRRQGVRRKQIEDRWRKPRGIDSKMKVGKRGKGPMVKIGYKHGEAAEEPFRVFRPEDLEKATAGAKIIIAAGVGGKKKEAILKKAREMKVRIANVRAG